MDRILELYKNTAAKEVDITLLQDVDIDNVCFKLNQAFGGHFSYDTDLIHDFVHQLKVTLYTPIKIVTGYAAYNTNSDLEQTTKQALASAVRLGFDFRTQTAAPTTVAPTKDIAATTLKDIEDIEKEIAASIENQEDKEIKVENLGPVEFKQDPPNTTGNKFGIRPDQIEFMKTFQEEYHIDTTEKFDEYVKAFASTQSMYIIQNKKQLIGCGPDAVDAFIAWVKEVNGDNDEFNEPSDEEINECTK